MESENNRSSTNSRAGADQAAKTGIFDKSISLLLTILFISNTIYGLASPFLPVELAAKGISSGMTGVIFAMYAVASVLSALVVGMYLDRIGHRCVIMFGALLMSVAIACFGLIESLTDKLTILVLSMSLRFLQGMASGAINTSVYSYVAQAYPDKVEKVISLSEGFVGIGCTLGPILGAFIYQAVGFSYTFYIFGAAMAPFALLICSCLDKPKLGSQQDEVDDGEIVEIDRESD